MFYYRYERMPKGQKLDADYEGDMRDPIRYCRALNLSKTETAGKILREIDSVMPHIQDTVEVLWESCEPKENDYRRVIHDLREENGALVANMKALIDCISDRSGFERYPDGEERDHGYVLLYSEETDYTGLNADGEEEAIYDVWMTTMQLPFPVCVPYDFVVPIVMHEFAEAAVTISGELDLCVPECTSMWNMPFEDVMDFVTERVDPKYNFVFTAPRFEADYLSGYWQCSFYHTKALHNIPSQFYPPRQPANSQENRI